VTAAFGACFAFGLERIRRWRPRSVALVAGDLALVSLLGVAVFWHGLLFDARAIRGAFPLTEASMANHYGVVYYAGRDRAAAHELFARAAADDLYLGYENLALLAFEDGRPVEALHLLKRALRLQPAQSPGKAADRALYDRITRAEYLNLVAVFEYGRGRVARAARAAAAALELDPTLPEAHYDLALALLEQLGPGATGSPARARAQQQLDDALAFDPGFAEARALRAIVEGGCGAGRVASAAWQHSAPGNRRYPVETGVGAPYAASIGRRRHILDPPNRLRAAGCEGPTSPNARATSGAS
jgi:tetratricopeptide (TPR) repeat protein